MAKTKTPRVINPIIKKEKENKNKNTYLLSAQES